MLSENSSPAAKVRRFINDRKGSTAILMAILMPLIIAGLAFGSEFGYWEHSKRRLQNAADTAAFAAGTQLRSGLDVDDLEAAALLIAEQSGYDTSVGTLTLASPPVDGAYAGDTDAVHLRLTQTLERRFSKIYHSSAVTLPVEATALVTSGRPACVLSLHPSASGAVDTGGSTNVTLAGCDVAANSISSSAVSSSGGAASITTDCVSTVGQVDDPHSNFTYADCPAPIENGPTTKDPYASVPEPTCASYQNSNAFLRRGNPSNPGTGTAGAINCYENVGALSRNVVLEPDEVYVLLNSDLRLNGSRTISGTGVTIFLTGNSSVTVNGNASIDISAPTSGTYSGLALWGDGDDEIDMDLSGNSGVSIVGAIYSPNSSSDITYTGNTSSFSAGECTQVIGGTVTFWGSSDFDTDCSNSGTKDIQTAQSIKIVE